MVTNTVVSDIDPEDSPQGDVGSRGLRSIFKVYGRRRARVLRASEHRTGMSVVGRRVWVRSVGIDGGERWRGGDRCRHTAGNLIERARARAEGLRTRFEEADAEALPFEDADFDVVVSLIGAMFAPRPDLVAKELLRVCVRGNHCHGQLDAAGIHRADIQGCLEIHRPVRDAVAHAVGRRTDGS